MMKTKRNQPSKKVALKRDYKSVFDEGDASDAAALCTDNGFVKVEHKPNLSKPPQKKKKYKDNDTNKVKPPTLEEMKELRDTRNLFHSYLFKLQVKEMLEELQLKAKYTDYIEKWLENFASFTKQLEDGLMDRCQLEVPLHLHKKTINFIFSKPEQPPQLIGAAAEGALLQPNFIVDIALEMPKKCFEKEDYLNLIYDQKRALYLAYVTDKMKSSPNYSQDQFAYNYYANNPLKPVMELTPSAKIGKHMKFRLFITAPQETFRLGRFVPSNNNIRPMLFNDEWNAEEQSLPSTPHYNSNILFDLTLSANQSLLNKSFQGRRNFQDGLLLLKVWLRQRQLDVGFSGFSSHILAMYIVYLNQQRVLHQSSSSYQVARTVWNQLANSDWTQCISLSKEQFSYVSGYYDVCFMDITGYYNLCSNVPLAVYKRIQDEAKLAVDLLNDMKINSFPYIFMQKCPLYTRVDNILKITKPSSVQQLLLLQNQTEMKYDYANYGYPQMLKTLTNLLEKGLGQRIHGIIPLETAVASWPVDTKAPIIGQSIQLGLILNPDYAYEVMDKGPASHDNAEGAAEFRSFWGDKSNLRRFQDGSICEAVVWAAVKDTPAKKRLIVKEICLHLLEHHFKLDKDDVQYIANELDVVYKLTPAFKVGKLIAKGNLKQELEQDTDAEALSTNVIRCYDELARQLHALDDLPLEIVSISGISPVFRYCESQPVLPQARLLANRRIYANQVQRIVIQLGQSGKWPNELAALRALKTAFLIEIGEKLKAQCHLNWSLTCEGLLVMKRGYCFLLELAHSKELALLKQQVNERGITTFVDNPQSRDLERCHYILPKVSGALHSLHQTHPAYGPTVLIAKQWLASQLIDNGLWSPMATELLVAHLFQQRHAPQITAAPQTGFIRLLQLLAFSDWQGELILLNFNNSWEEQHIANLEHNFRSERESYPPLALATSYDQQHAGRLWTTDRTPNRLVLNHVTKLAGHALELIETHLMSKSLQFVRPAQLFRASNEGYDLVIQIKPDLVANSLNYDLGSPFVNFGQPNFNLPLARQDRLGHVVAQLRSAYSDYAAFFYNPHGGKELAIRWKPQDVFAPKPFKVNELQATTPCDGNRNQVRISRDTLLEDFKLLLKDFFARICTTEELKREQKQHQKPKRYFQINSEQLDNESSQPKKPQQKLTKAKHLKTLVLKPKGKKVLLKSKPLNALCT